MPIAAKHARDMIGDAHRVTGAEARVVHALPVGAAGAGVQEVRVRIDQMWMMRWDDPAMESRFLMRALEDGVLFKRGAYNYAAVAHDDDALQQIEAAASAALVTLVEENAE